MEFGYILYPQNFGYPLKLEIVKTLKTKSVVETEIQLPLRIYLVYLKKWLN